MTLRLMIQHFLTWSGELNLFLDLSSLPDSSPNHSEAHLSLSNYNLGRPVYAAYRALSFLMLVVTCHRVQSSSIQGG